MCWKSTRWRMVPLYPVKVETGEIISRQGWLGYVGRMTKIASPTRISSPRPERFAAARASGRLRSSDQRQLRSDHRRGHGRDRSPQAVKRPFRALGEQQVTHAQPRNGKEEGGRGRNKAKPRSKR
jgi:hypothetical protein